jgi:hypothetical protein
MVPTGYLPEFAQPLVGLGSRIFPSIFGEGGLEIGPIPEGTPVDLLSNLDLRGEPKNDQEKRDREKQVVDLVLTINKDLLALSRNPSDEQAKKDFANVVEKMLALSKCPDFIVNRGHYFGTSMLAEEPGLSDDDKRALIEYVKTF